MPKNQPKDMNFIQTALTDPNNNAKESISFSQFCTSFEMYSLTSIYTNQNNNNSGTPNSMIPQLQTNCDTFGQYYLSAGCRFELLQEAST